VLELSLILLSLYDPNFYSYNSYYTLGILATTITVILQIYLIIYEFKKNVPLFYVHKLYWIFTFFSILVSVLILISVSQCYIFFREQAYSLILLSIHWDLQTCWAWIYILSSAKNKILANLKTNHFSLHIFLK
jgi:hypothetical protein